MLDLAVEGNPVQTGGRGRRRQGLVEAALSAFATKGVAATSVDDIVRAAGVAKGTFYLYFTTKDEIVDAVAQRMIEGVSGRIEESATDSSRTPVERVVAFGRAIRQVDAAEGYQRDLIEVFHRPENRAIHDRLGEQLVAQMKPTMTAIVSDGMDKGLFQRQDAARAATFVLACFSVLHDMIGEPADVPAAIDDLEAFVLRGLGYGGELPR